MNNNLSPFCEELTKEIINELKKEFGAKHLSGNLLRTIKIERDYLNKKIIIKIPAQTYDLFDYQTKKIIRYTGGSYAERLNEKGSQFMAYNKNAKNPKQGRFINVGNHKNFAENVSINGINNFINKNVGMLKIDMKKV